MSRTSLSASAPFRERMERLEESHRSPLATRSYPALREREEPDSDHRTPFQRDRDRIVHSKAFRRLKHKTQVFIAPEGDHYRTRLTHTLEACGIARNVSRALALNEDLTEAIGLGHDLGHPPFGHIGEEVLDACVRERWDRSFRHNEHSLRVVERIEALNLTEQVREGILRHTGPTPPSTMEGRIVRLVDRIAYINHDIDDAVRAGILRFDDLPQAEIELLGATGPERIETLVSDLLARSDDAGDIVQGEEVGGAMLRLRTFMFDSVYLSAGAQREKPRIERMLRTLFDHYAAEPPPALTDDAGPEQRVIDWLAGMTDRFAVRTFADLSLPRGVLSVALFTKDSIERVREAVDMVGLVGAKTDLRRVGTRWVGLCPFHDERSPSFSVDAERKLYHCFGCQKGGDAIGFLQEVEGLDFPESVEALAERYNVRLEREDDDPEAEKRRQERDRLRSLLDRTARFYAAYLETSAEAAKAREYLAGRGLSAEVLKEFRVGYSPSAWDRVLVSAQRDGYSPQELLDAGLAQRNPAGSLYDRFRGRIMFPLADARGRVLGFGARAMSEGRGPKYLNSSESRIYRKGRQLFGIDVARPHATKSGRVVVVEGYTDVLAMHQAGIPETVAIMGTALTEDQVFELAKVAKRVILALDADRAGQEAMLRAARVARDRDLELAAVEMPAGADPADLLATRGADEMNALLERASGMIEFQVRRVLADAELDTPAGRDRALDSARRLISDVPESSALRHELVRTVADRLDLPTNLVTAEVPRSRDSERRFAPAPPARSPGAIALAPEEAFLATCLASGEAGHTQLSEISPELFSSQLMQQAREHLVANFHDPLAGLSEGEAELGRLVAGVVARAETQGPAAAPSLRMSFLQLELRRIERDLRRAAETADRARQDELAGARQDVRREMDAVMGQTA